MEDKSKNGTNPAEEKTETKKIPIIQTLKPKKRFSKLEKELIKAGRAAMQAIGRNQERLKQELERENGKVS